jgi:hypothetical protein
MKKKQEAFLNSNQLIIIVYHFNIVCIYFYIVAIYATNV